MKHTQEKKKIQQPMGYFINSAVGIVMIPLGNRGHGEIFLGIGRSKVGEVGVTALRCNFWALCQENANVLPNLSSWVDFIIFILFTLKETEVELG